MTVDASGCVIRPAIHADVPRLIELLQIGSPDPNRESANFGDYEAALDEINHGGPGCVLVAELDGDVIGAVQLVIFRHLRDQGRKCAELESLNVHRDYQLHGIGTALIAAAEAYAKSAGCYRIQLLLNKSLTDLHQFYEHHGYEPSHVGLKRLL